MRPNGRPGVSPILEGRLLIGEYPTPDDVAWLRDEHRVRAVVSLQDDADLASKNLALAALERAYRAAGLTFHHHPVRDGDAAALAAHLPAIVACVHALVAAGEPVYVHCNGGFNRAPTVAIAYLHLHLGHGIEEAIEAVKQRRACAPYRTALELCFGAR